MNTNTNGVKLSPTLRFLISVALGVGVLVLGLVQDGAFTVEDAVQTALAIALAFGIVPSQLGGTQHGVVQPAVTEPPAANVDERGFSEVSFLLVLAGVGLGILVAVLLL